MKRHTKYDLIFSIGEACSCTELLRELNLQDNTYPFDWVYGSNLIDRVANMCSPFKHPIIKFIGTPATYTYTGTNVFKGQEKLQFKNIETGLIYNHDFIAIENKEPEMVKMQQWPDFELKMQRRWKRLLKQLENPVNTVLAVWVTSPAAGNYPTLAQMETIYKDLNSAYKAQIDLLVMENLDNHLDYTIAKIHGINAIKCVTDYDGYNDEFPYFVNRERLAAAFSYTLAVLENERK